MTLWSSNYSSMLFSPQKYCAVHGTGRRLYGTCALFSKLKLFLVPDACTDQSATWIRRSLRTFAAQCNREVMVQVARASTATNVRLSKLFTMHSFEIIALRLYLHFVADHIPSAVVPCTRVSVDVRWRSVTLSQRRSFHICTL